MTAALSHHRLDGPPDAPVLALSNSIGTDLRLWDAQLPVLTRHFRVLCYDARGHGSTPWRAGALAIDDLARDLLALLDHLGIARASIAGISLGGMTALALARLAPTRVDRLVLCSTSARLGPPESWQERAALVRANGMGAVAGRVLARWFTPGFSETHSGTVASASAMLLATEPQAYAACCEAIAGMDLHPTLHAISAPTLVIAGALDPATPPEHGAAIANAIPGARLVVIPEAAHLANLERPDLVTAAILSHLAPAAILDDAALRLSGDRVRREVLGDAHVDAARSRATPFSADFQDYITQTAWGSVWSRPGLDRRTRSAITVAMLVALGHDNELALHVRAARTNGVSLAELREILIQTAVYCGVPAANHAFQVASAALGVDVNEA